MTLRKNIGSNKVFLLQWRFGKGCSGVLVNFVEGFLHTVYLNEKKTKKKNNFETGLAALLVWSFSRPRGSLENSEKRHTVEAWRHLPILTCPGYIYIYIYTKNLSVFTCPGYLIYKNKRGQDFTLKKHIAFFEIIMVELVKYRQQISKFFKYLIWSYYM